MKMLEYPKEYQNYIERSPVPKEQMYAKSTSNDERTIESFRDTWIDHFKQNHKNHGPFAKRSIASEYKKHLGRPCILIGSGPHLKENIHLLKGREEAFVVVSCLHNFHYLKDLGIKVDYWVSLDAQQLVIDEVSEGGDPKKDYFSLTQSETLVGYVCSHPNLFKKWKGRVLFFNSPVPDKKLQDTMEATERFNCHLSTGGNVLGASFYFAKAWLGCSTVIFLGASFSFDNDDKFHSWDSKYDKKQGNVLRVPDIFGYKVKTWPSYYNFCNWFNYVCENLPGDYYNCTEGGCLGAYLEGNIRSIKQMNFQHVLDMFYLSDHVSEQAKDSRTDKVKILI